MFRFKKIQNCFILFQMFSCAIEAKKTFEEFKIKVGIDTMRALSGNDTLSHSPFEDFTNKPYALSVKLFAIDEKVSHCFNETTKKVFIPFSSCKSIKPTNVVLTKSDESKYKIESPLYLKDHEIDPCIFYELLRKSGEMCCDEYFENQEFKGYNPDAGIFKNHAFVRGKLVIVCLRVSIQDKEAYFMILRKIQGMEPQNTYISKIFPSFPLQMTFMASPYKRGHVFLHPDIFSLVKRQSYLFNFASEKHPAGDSSNLLYLTLNYVEKAEGVKVIKLSFAKVGLLYGINIQTAKGIIFKLSNKEIILKPEEFKIFIENPINIDCLHRGQIPEIMFNNTLEDDRQLPGERGDSQETTDKLRKEKRERKEKEHEEKQENIRRERRKGILEKKSEAINFLLGSSSETEEEEGIGQDQQKKVDMQSKLKSQQASLSEPSSSSSSSCRPPQPVSQESLLPILERPTIHVQAPQPNLSPVTPGLVKKIAQEEMKVSTRAQQDQNWRSEYNISLPTQTTETLGQQKGYEKYQQKEGKGSQASKQQELQTWAQKGNSGKTTQQQSKGSRKSDKSGKQGKGWTPSEQGQSSQSGNRSSLTASGSLGQQWLPKNPQNQKTQRAPSVRTPLSLGAEQIAPPPGFSPAGKEFVHGFGTKSIKNLSPDTPQFIQEATAHLARNAQQFIQQAGEQQSSSSLSPDAPVFVPGLSTAEREIPLSWEDIQLQ